VAVEVFVVELPAKKANDTGTGPDEKYFSGTIANVTKRLDVLMREGPVAGFKRIRLTTLEGQLSSLLLGETKPFVIGTSVAGTGITTKQITYRKIGTRVKVTPQVAADGSVTLALDMQDSRSRESATATVGKDEKGKVILATEFIEASLSGKIRVASGMAVLARDTVVTSKAGQGEMLIVVGARVAEAEARAK
jgi:type II secretory pathway component HofQ